jgi:YVTN family beta-propeller protein
MKPISKLLAAALFGVASVIAHQASAQQKTGFHVIKDHYIKSVGGWDYINVNAANNRIYVSHGIQVNVLDATTGDSVGVILDTKGVHGIAVANDLGKGYTSNGRANAVTVFDLKTNQALKQVSAGTNPDAILYDDFSKKVYAFNGRSKDATVIDATTDEVVATIPLGGKPETGVSDGKGHIYVNIEDTNEEVQIDAKTNVILNRWKIASGDEPSGLSIDRKTMRLFIGCGGNKNLVIMDANNGSEVAKFPIGRCDATGFDPELKLIYVSNGEGTITVVRELSANKFEFVETIPTQPGARTMAVNEASHHLFLPTAKSEPAPPPTTENPNPRPKQIPGTFHVIEVGK